MTPRCACGNRKLSGDVSCLSCASWARRLAAGSAPEFSMRRAAAPVPAGTKREGASLDHSFAPSRAAASRHPSTRPRHLQAVGPCLCHNTEDRFSCEPCIANGELDYELHGGVDL